MATSYDQHEIGGRDPLDAGPIVVGQSWLSRMSRRLRTRVALGLPPVLAPAMVFVPVGVFLGPRGLNVLNAAALSHLTPALSTALAALGIFVGLALSRRRDRAGPLLMAATVESGLTVLIVTAATAGLLSLWQVPVATSGTLLALMLGVCAAASSAGYEESLPGSPPSIAARIADLDDLLPIIAGGIALAALGSDGLTAAVLRFLSTIALGALIGAAGTLLIERAHSEAERGLFILGILALTGGAPSYLGLSPLLAGLTAGIVWNFGPGGVDVILRKEMQRYQHPLVVLLLLAAGASLYPSREALWFFAPFVLFRVTGKITGGWVASRFAPGLAPADLGEQLLAPGLMGLAFALYVGMVLAPPDGPRIMTAVVAGTLVSEVLALIVAPKAVPGPVAAPTIARST